MEKRKVLGTIIGVLAFIALVAGISFAWFSWQSSNNTLVSFTVGGVDITYSAGADITSSKLRPVSTKEVGVSKGYAVKKTITASSPLTAYLNLYLTLETLPNGLKHESFIWELYKGSDLVGKGNFKNSNQGDKVRIASSQKITNTTSTYDLYIWIDGNNYDNPETMQNQTFKFVLSADATDQEPPALTTLTNLGLSANEGNPNFNVAATTNEGIYAAEDDLGTSYYFRGAVENNYVKFAGYYWRIIRINGDGTIRMIYDGTSVHANGEESEDRQVGITAFNTNYDDNAYVGYMYGTPASSTYEATHANINDSTIKTANDAWYKTNIQDKGYGDYVADAIYCSDRQVAIADYWNYIGNGTGTQTTAYSIFNRVIYDSEIDYWSSVSPTLKCAQANDRFTTSTSLGNGDLTYPVGLLTIDEANMAGGDIVNMSLNNSYYLYTGDRYWLFSPYYFNSDSAFVWNVGAGGGLDAVYVNRSVGLRPVISLKSNIGFSGNGTMNNPFEIS